MKSGRVKRVSVALMSSNPKQYQELMNPQGAGDQRGHADVCQFIAACAEAGIEVECTAVKKPGVDWRAAKELSEALGAVGFRAREYFP